MLEVLHTDRGRSELEVIPGIHFAAQRDHIDYLVRRSKRPFRVFVGHSGCGKGQLEDELEEGAWLTMPATTELVFADESEIWKIATRRIGREMLFDTLNLPVGPEDPMWN